MKKWTGKREEKETTITAMLMADWGGGKQVKDKRSA